MVLSWDKGPSEGKRQKVAKKAQGTQVGDGIVRFAEAKQEDLTPRNA